MYPTGLQLNYRRPSSAFFSLCHPQKNFSETTFTKLPPNPYQCCIIANFTNHFSALCRSITKDDLYSLSLAYPPVFVLQRFEQLVSNLDKQIFIQSNQNQQLATLREWLFPMLLNGQVSVGKAYEEVAEALSMAAEEDTDYKKP